MSGAGSLQRLRRGLGAPVVSGLAVVYLLTVAVLFRSIDSPDALAFSAGHLPYLIALVIIAGAAVAKAGSERIGLVALAILLGFWELAAWTEPIDVARLSTAQALPVTTVLALAGYAFGLVAVLRLAPPQLGMDAKEGLQAASVVVIATAALVQYVLPHEDPGALANLTASAYPAMDAVILTLIVLSFFGDEEMGRPRAVLLMIAFGGLFVADIAVLGDRAGGHLPGAALDLSRHSIAWLFAIAAVIDEDMSIPVPSWVNGDRFLGFAQSALPFGIILPGAVAVTVHGWLGQPAPALTAGTFVAAALLLGRQSLIAADNRNLYAHRKQLLTSFNAKAAELEREVVERRRAEVALRRTEERFRAVAENLDEGLLLANDVGRIVYANPRMAKLAGYDRSEFLGRRAEDVLEPWDQWGDLIGLVGTSEGTSVRREIPSITVDGEAVWLDGYARSFHPGGDDASVIAIAIDVTARKLAEEEAVTRANDLSRHNKALEQLSSSAAFNAGLQAAATEIAAVGADTLRAAATSIWLVDDEAQSLRLFACNSEDAGADSAPELPLADCSPYLEMLGTEGSVAISDVRSDIRIGTVTEKMRRSADTVSTLDVPVRLFGQTVGVIRGEHTGTPRHWTAAECSFCVSLAGFMATVLEADKRQEALARAARLAAVLSATPDMVAMFDNDGRAVFINESARQVLGLPVGADISSIDLDTFHPAHALPLLRDRGLPAALIHGAWSGETVVAAADGTEVPVSQVILSHREGGGTRYVATIMRDLTEARRAAEERENLSRKLQEAHKLESLGLLAGGVAHDFNNLLQAMLGNAQVARLAIAPEVEIAHESLSELETAARRAADLVRQLLAFAGSGQQGITPANPSSLVEDTVRLLLAVVTRRATVNLHLAPDLPLVEADAVQLRQMVMNLVTNAADAIGTSGGTIDVSTTIVKATAAFLKDCFLGEALRPGQYVAIEVKDTGAGMDKDTVARIFDPFFTTKSYGHGLGLAAVLGTVRSHGGALHVDSRPGRGTTFTVLLPPLAQEKQHPATRGQNEAA